MSSWLKTMDVRDDGSVTITDKSGVKYEYTGVPEPVRHALQLAGSPGRIWHALYKGRYNERILK